MSSVRVSPRCSRGTEIVQVALSAASVSKFHLACLLLRSWDESPVEFVLKGVGPSMGWLHLLNALGPEGLPQECALGVRVRVGASQL